MNEKRSRDEGRLSRPGPLGRRLLFARLWLYGVIVLGLLIFRVVPGLRSELPEIRLPGSSSHTLTLAGLDLAPELIPRLVAEYRSLYPELDIRILSGGTRHAVEHLLNQRADVAFLNRPLTEAEASVVKTVGDSVMIFPVALGGITVVAAESSPVDSLSLAQLRELISGRGPMGVPLPGAGRGEEMYERLAEGEGVVRLYAADPNLGLWAALTTQLGLPEEPSPAVNWLASEREVISAVERDPASLGITSTLALASGLERSGWRTVRLISETKAAATSPNAPAIATGAYPLYHYLHVACLPDGGQLASGFVSFLFSGRGQRLIQREGFLPAREVAREIQLVQRPLGSTG